MKRKNEPVREIFSRHFEQTELQKEVASYKEKFADKPYVVAARPVYRIATSARFFTGLLSIGTGSVFLTNVVTSAGLPFLVAGLIAVVLMVLVEMTKNALTESAAIHWLKNRKVSPFAFTAGLMFCLSVAASLFGIMDFHRLTDATIKQATISAEASADSIAARYDAMIAKEEAALADYRKSVSWAGKIDVSNKATQTVLATHAAQIARLQNEKAAALAAYQVLQAETIADAKNISERNGLAWLILCITNEAVIAACLLFIFHYQYRAITENFAAAQKHEISIEEVRELIQFFAPAEKGLTLPAFGAEDEVNPAKIGFNPNKAQNSENKQETKVNPRVNPGLTPVKSQQELRAFLAKYRHVVRAIEAGHPVSAITEKYQLSRSTVKNVRRCMQVLKTSENN